MDKLILGNGPGFSDVESEGSGPFSFVLAMRNAPSCAPDPPQHPICHDTPRCEGCPYCGHGFVCRGRDGACMRSEVARINHFIIAEEEHELENTGNTEQQESPGARECDSPAQ